MAFSNYKSISAVAKEFSRWLDSREFARETQKPGFS